MSWKDHPIVIAAGTCVATIGVCYKLLVPAYTTALENQVIKNKEELSAMTEKVQSAEARSDRVERINNDLLVSRALSFCSPYPIGLDGIKIGDSIDRVPSEYPGSIASTEPLKRWVGVKISDSPLFSDVTYYYNKETSKVTALLLFNKERDGIGFSETIRDRYKETAQQLAMVKQARSAFPTAKVELDKEEAEPSYIVSVNGKTVMEIRRTNYLIPNSAAAITSKACQ